LKRRQYDQKTNGRREKKNGRKEEEIHFSLSSIATTLI
jgi:hypothetical protein